MSCESRYTRLYIGVWMAILLVFVCTMGACATDENIIAIVNNPVMTDVLNLREEPSIESTSLGRYYNGTQVIAEGSFGHWTKVRIGDARGYMMSQFLRFAWEADNEPVTISDTLMGKALWGIVCTAPSDPTLAVQGAPQIESDVLVYVDDGEMLQILGEVDESWLHVRTADGNHTGYVPEALMIRGLMQDALGNGCVVTEKDEIAPIYAKSDTTGRIINGLRSGAQVRTFGSENGYVLIGLQTGASFLQYGYIDMKYLHESFEDDSRLTNAYVKLPANVDSALLYKRPSEEAEAIGSYQEGSKLVVFGELGDFYFVCQMEVQGFIRKDYLQLSDRMWSYTDRRHQDAIGFGIVRTEDKQLAPLLRFSEDNGNQILVMAEDGDRTLVYQSEGDWAQVYYVKIPGPKGQRSVPDASMYIYELFMQNQYLDIIPVPSLQKDVEAFELRAGEYVVGEDLPADIYSLRVPEGKEGAMTVTVGDNQTVHTPVTKGSFCIYSLYLPEGAKITIENDAVLTDMDKTWVWGKVYNAAYSGGYGRFLSTVNIDEIGMHIKLLPDATEGYYRVIPIDMDAQGIVPEPVYVQPGESVVPPMGFGVFLELYNCYIWTNG